MILERLRAYWDEQPDRVRPGYQHALFTKWIKLDARGELLGIISLSGDGTKVREGLRKEVPREQPRRVSNICPRLVHDNGNYVLGFVGEVDKPSRVGESHAAYLKLLQQAYEVTGDPAFDLIRRWAQRQGTLEAAKAYGVEAKDDLWITVDGVDPTASQTAEAFWNRPSGENAHMMRCLVTGEVVEVGEAMPYPIKGVPGGQVSGTMLVSVNFAAGESYGLKRSLNSPISKTAAEAICNALNRLLASENNSYRVGETVYVYWVRGQAERDALHALKDPQPEEIDELMARFKRPRRPIEPEARRVGTAIASPREGLAPPKVDPIDVVVIALTANASRIVVRDYHELTLPKLDARLAEWFARLELRGVDGKPLPRPKLTPLAYCAYRDKKDMPKHVPVSLIDSALRGARLPESLLATAVRRNVVEQGPYSTYQGVRRMSYARLALIKACLSPHPSPYLQENDPLSALNPNHENAAYHCGRLLAVIDSIQRAYFKVEGREINRTVVDRHYGGTSTAPGISFGPLLADATQAHLGKLQRNQRTRSTYTALERDLREVLESLEELPQTLDHYEQGLFALGFYHQRTSSIERALKRKAAGEADDATEALIDTTVTASEEDETE
jgi:CRISPR-associated protein Csd1